jgi:putative DNA primase/helicase
VRAERIDVEALERDRAQLFAEAVAAYRAGEIWHLTGEEAALAVTEQSDRVLVTELEADVAEYLAISCGTRAEVTVREVLVHALRLDPDKGDFAERAGRLGPQVAGALERAGWTKVRTMGRGQARRTIYRATHRESHG